MRHLFALSAAFLAACGDSSGPSNAIPEELAGSWEALQACLPECGFTLQRVGVPGDSVNFVASLPGAIFLLDMTRSGGFDLRAPTAGVTIRGTVRAEGSMLILRDDAGTQDTADWSISNEYLQLQFRGVTEEFDFDADGTGDPATVRARFRRR